MSDGKRGRHPLGAGMAALGGSASDGHLLGRYVLERDGAAFEGLVRRHGPMVLGVCRRVTGHEQDAEDAFQATFLVLARRAASVQPRERVGSWLYGVAHRTALKARGRAARARAAERRGAEARGPTGANRTDATRDDLGPVLDRELARLPDLYRDAVVLCDLEGRPRREVARQLGIPEGTLSSRLTAGRKRLAARLTRRGVAVTSGMLAVALGQAAAAGGLPPALVAAAVRVARAVAAGGGVIAAAPQVLGLADDVLRSLRVARLKLAGLALATAALGAAGLVAGIAPPPGKPPAGPREAAVVARPTPEPRPDGHPGLRRQLATAEWVLSAVDLGRRTVTVTDQPGAGGPPIVAVPDRPQLQPAGVSVQALPVDRGARVELDGRPADLDALRPGMRVSLRLHPDRLVADRVVAASPRPPGADDRFAAYEVTAVDPGRGVISVRDPVSRLAMDGLRLAPDAEVEVWVVGRDPAVQLRTWAGTVRAVEPGMRVGLVLTVGADGHVTVRKVRAPG